MGYLGIDIGTTGCKAVAFNEQGNQVSDAYREYPVISKEEGWAELDSRQVMDSCFEVIREAVAGCPATIEGLGISSQGEAFTPVDKDGNAIGNGMVSFDTRAAKIAETWSRCYGEQKLYEITGHTPHTMFTIFKLLWVKENQPEVWGKADKLLCFEDLLQYHLGVDPAMGWSLAGRTMMFDVNSHQWNQEILDHVGITADQLARPLPSGTVSGTIPHKIAQQLGLQDGVIVVTGGHDQACGALGAGVISPGTAMYATGTVECITPAFSDLVLSEQLFKSNLCTYDFSVKDMYTTVAFSLTGGNILKWYRDEFGQQEKLEADNNPGGTNAYELIVSKMPAKPTSLMVLPYFTPTGTPYFDTEATGSILGLKLTTTRDEFVKALLEGVTFEMKLNLDILDQSGIHIKELRAIGGGAKSPIWSQLKADVLNTPITTVEVTEAGCLGCAMLACAAKTGEDVKNIAGRWVKMGRVIEPKPGNAEIYAEKFKRYKTLYPTLKPLM